MAVRQERKVDLPRMLASEQALNSIERLGLPLLPARPRGPRHVLGLLLGPWLVDSRRFGVDGRDPVLETGRRWSIGEHWSRELDERVICQLDESRDTGPVCGLIVASVILNGGEERAARRIDSLQGTDLGSKPRCRSLKRQRHKGNTIVLETCKLGSLETSRIEQPSLEYQEEREERRGTKWKLDNMMQVRGPQRGVSLDPTSPMKSPFRPRTRPARFAFHESWYVPLKSQGWYLVPYWVAERRTIKSGPVGGKIVALRCLTHQQKWSRETV
ncbi:1427_t:CDS:2 [Acaulospora colombiana]|uniref:1427_t:CDS:1 n=1 Tax=Acaulospora colombiana TaxID=27376 RepID=A0ACA9MP23_9GLOM|nr:1427_t:CDS:2 [Acaulospora colombiana]